MRLIGKLGSLLTIIGLTLAPLSAAAWEPTKPIEFVIPAGTGGGADQMARLIHGIAEKHKLSPQPFVVVNKSGGAGAEGFLHVKGKKGDAHTIIITLSNLFTTPLAQGTPFNWKDLTPVARMALDRFILWVNSETPYKSARDYLEAAKSKQCKEREGGQCSMGGTGSKQEDQIITVQLEQALSLKFTYVPFKGGGEVCVNLVGKHVDSTVNNPAESLESGAGASAGGLRSRAHPRGRVEGHSDREGGLGHRHPVPDAPRNLRSARNAERGGGLVQHLPEKGV
jgi:tripartite-type tricarboxylate transporter receptor subunit TctC